MELNEKDIRTIEELIKEVQLHRLDEEEDREMTVDGLYEDEIELAEKLGIVI